MEGWFMSSRMTTFWSSTVQGTCSDPYQSLLPEVLIRGFASSYVFVRTFSYSSTLRDSQLFVSSLSRDVESRVIARVI